MLPRRLRRLCRPKATRLGHPVSDARNSTVDIVIRYVEGEHRKQGLADQVPHQLLLMNELLQIIILRRVAEDLEASRARCRKGLQCPSHEDQVETDGIQPLLEPAERVVSPLGLELIGTGGDVEAVDDPRVVALQLEEPGPGVIRLHGPALLV